MNKLRSFFDNNKSNLINKWDHYFDIYDNHLRKYKDSGKKVVLLEIGIFQGGSINMWKDYFDNNVEIYAIDINPLCKSFEQEGVKIFIGSQEDKAFMESVAKQIPNPDIIIDDGGHSMNQLITSFEVLYPCLKEGGIYLLEDLHTCYWYNYGGGFEKPDTLIEYSKHFIDKMHAWYSESDRLKPDYYTKNIYGMHYYDSILIFDKKVIVQPESHMSGNYVFTPEQFEEVFPTEKPKTMIQKLVHRIKFRVHKIKYG